MQGGRRSAQFLQRNLELLGFGNHKDALIQTVKELFENALDAIVTSSPTSSWEDAPLEMLRVYARLNNGTGCIDVVCADTGSGIRTHQIKQLCCGAFETTKGAVNGEKTAGKYGVGLKAALLYSQNHLNDSYLRIATTAHSNEILYVQLRIDPESEETAVVKEVSHFVVNDDHKKFSGTEMRISLPCPTKITEIEEVADSLAMYFQSLRYTVPPFVGVEFEFEVHETMTRVECLHSEQPVDRFVTDLGATIDDIVYAHQDKNGCTVNCMAFLGEIRGENTATRMIEICLLRYANHVPLLNSDDFFLCGITKGVSNKRIWKKLGFHCQRTSSHLVNQLVVTPQRPSPGVDPSDDTLGLVLAVDVCSSDLESDARLRYGSLKKSTLDKCYAKQVQHCCQDVLQKLVEYGKLRTPQQNRDEELITIYAPLIANAAASIASHKQLYSNIASNQHQMSCDFDTLEITRRLQDLLRRELA